jgi:hypothetical protein
MDRTSGSRGHKHDRLRTICLLVSRLEGSTGAPEPSRAPLRESERTPIAHNVGDPARGGPIWMLSAWDNRLANQPAGRVRCLCESNAHIMRIASY